MMDVNCPLCDTDFEADGADVFVEEASEGEIPEAFVVCPNCDAQITVEENEFNGGGENY